MFTKPNYVYNLDIPIYKAMEKKNIIKTLSLLVNELNIPLTDQSIKDEIERHPSQGSLLAISDLLKNWCIPNASYKLGFEELLKTEIPLPFVVQLTSGFALVTKFDKDTIIISNEKVYKKQINMDE